MIKKPTIPCPVCGAPVHVREVQLPSGDIARVFVEPMTVSDNYIDFHEHQIENKPVSAVSEVSTFSELH